MPKIIKTEQTIHDVKITLDNGITLSVTPNEGYFHINLCGVEVPMQVGVTTPSDEQGKSNVANVLNVYYKTR